MRKMSESVPWSPLLVRALFCLSLTALIAFSVIGAITHLSKEAKPASRQPSSALQRIQFLSSDQEVQGLVIALRPEGFSPPQIEISEGRYLFVVQNRSGNRDLTFRLDRVAGERLYEVHDQKLQWKKEFDLVPGTYLLSVAEHPEWECVIRVMSR